MRNVVLVTALAVVSLESHALQINLNYDTNGQVGSVPVTDPQGTQLMALAQAAADYWEDIIEDNHTLDVIVRYDNSLTAPTIGLWNSGVEVNGRWVSGVISIKGSTPWFYDSTPTTHTEFQMTQVLYRNASAANAANFSGTVPGVLEISYTGAAAGGAPPQAFINTDLLSVLLHEFGHGLGLSVQLTTCSAEVADGDYDVNPALANGNSFSIAAALASGAHTTCQQCLMNANIPTGLRRLPCAADILALATAPNPGWSNIDIPRREFLPGGTVEWTTAANWVGARVPNFADDVYCRYGIDVPGNILLTLASGAVCHDLLMSGSTSVRTFNHKLDVGRNVTIEYDGNLPVPEIFVETGGELEAVDVTVNGGDLDLSGGLVDLSDDLILSEDTLGRQGNVSGYGTVDVLGTLVNNGRITATDGGTLTFISASTSPWDLDGASGVGEVFATTGDLDFSTGAVSDEFDGLLQITAPYKANFGESWTLGPGGEINLTGGSPQEATLSGALLQANDGILRAALRARVTAPVTFGASSETLVFPDSNLRLDGAVTFSGGAHLIGANSPVAFYGGGSILGGTFGLNAGSALEARSTVTVSGGTFNGSGSVKSVAPGRLQLIHGTDIGVAVVNEGGTIELGPGPAHVNVESFSQNIFGTLEVAIAGTPGSGNYDVLTVEQTASLAGTLTVAFNVPGAQAGDTWQIVSAGNIANGFSSMQVIGVPAGLTAVKFETDTGVYFKLTEVSSYLAWAEGKNLTPPDDLAGADPDEDGIVNAFEALLGGNPLVANPELWPTPTVINVSGTNYLALALNRDAATTIFDLQFGAGRSLDLLNWSGTDVTLHSVEFDPELCHEVFLYRSLVPFASLPKEFLRLEAQLLPR